MEKEDKIEELESYRPDLVPLIQMGGCHPSTTHNELLLKPTPTKLALSLPLCIVSMIPVQG